MSSVYPPFANSKLLSCNRTITIEKFKTPPESWTELIKKKKMEFWINVFNQCSCSATLSWIWFIHSMIITRNCQILSIYIFLLLDTWKASFQHLLERECLLVWWCLTPFSTIFQLYHAGQFYWWRKPEDRGKPPTCRTSLTNFIT